MKKKSFKIRRVALFVYYKASGLNYPMGETEPTTNTITLTHTGIFG